MVGDAKHIGGVSGSSPAKVATISEYVWLLENCQAQQTFLVFGNDRRASLLWPKRYGNLLSNTVFYYLADNGRLERLDNPSADLFVE